MAGYLFLTLRFFRKILLTSLYVSCIILSCEDDPLAQSVEHLTFNQGVDGSSPSWVTISSEPGSHEPIGDMRTRVSRLLLSGSEEEYSLLELFMARWSSG